MYAIVELQLHYLLLDGFDNDAYQSWTERDILKHIDLDQVKQIPQIE